MTSEQLSATSAVIAVLISLAALVWQWRSSEGRKDWEAEQERTRKRYARELQDAQNNWQLEQDEKRAKSEVAFRQEEVARREAWRAEDIARQNDLTRPKLDVSLNPGFHMNPVSGLSETLLLTEARNVGIVPVYFSNWGGFALPDGKWLQWPQAPNPSKYGSDFDFSQPLAPASSCSTYVELKILKSWLLKNGFDGAVEIRGYFRDRLGVNHFSNPYRVTLEDQQS